MKETNEIFDALELVINKVNAAFADGKIDWNDATLLISLVTEYKVFVEAVKCKELPAEYTSMSEEDAAAFAIRSYKFVKSIVDMINTIKNKPEVIEA